MGLHDRLHRQNGSTNGHGPELDVLVGGQAEAPERRAADPYAELKGRIHHACIAKLGPQLYAAGDADESSAEDLAEKVLRVVTEQLALDRTPLTREERRQVTREITDDILGYGPLEPLLRDDSVTEVMVNNHDRVYVERNGKLEVADAAFVDNAHLLRIIDKIVSQVGRRVDEASPMVDARLPDGSRVNAIIPPLSLRGADADDPEVLARPVHDGRPDQLRLASRPRRRSSSPRASAASSTSSSRGGTGTGKTTTLNALSAFVPNDERIVTIEDAAELQLQQDHVITLESRPPNIEGEGEIRIRELVRNALRMRPDRIIVGEVRGAETLDMLQAMNTGHEGSLTTIHANSPRDALSRLETLVMTAGVELPHRAIREQIASAFDLLVQISRLVDGSRRITHITEVLRMESDVITLQDVYIAKPPDEDDAAEPGKPVNLLNPLACTGLKPQFLEKMAANGVTLPPSFFGDNSSLPAELRSGELRRVRVSRRASRLLVAAVIAALVTPVAAGASLSLRGIDTSGYPTVRVTVVAPVARTAAPPTLTENGNQVVGLHAVNLAATKSVVIAIDRSRSMAGTKLADALEAARAFLRTKAPSDKVSVVGFGSKAVQLTPFTQSTAEADDALRLLKVDSKNGTALYDALQLSGSSLRTPGSAAPASSSCSPTARTSRARPRCRTRSATAHDTGTLVYPIAIGGDGATVAPLQADGRGDRRQLQVGRHQLEPERGLLVDRERAEADLARRVRHRRAAGRAAPPARVARTPKARPRPTCASPARPSAGRRRQRAAEPALLTARRAAADDARRVPRAHGLRVPVRLGQGLVGQDPPRPARRGARARRASARRASASPRSAASSARPSRRSATGASGTSCSASSSGPTCRCARSSSPT